MLLQDQCFTSCRWSFSLAAGTFGRVTLDYLTPELSTTRIIHHQNYPPPELSTTRIIHHQNYPPPELSPTVYYPQNHPPGPDTYTTVYHFPQTHQIWSPVAVRKYFRYPIIYSVTHLILIWKSGATVHLYSNQCSSPGMPASFVTCSRPNASNLLTEIFLIRELSAVRWTTASLNNAHLCLPFPTLMIPRRACAL